MTLKIGILSFAHMHAYSYASALAVHPDTAASPASHDGAGSAPRKDAEIFR